LSGNLTVSGGITAAGAGNSIVLAATQDFVNSVGAGALNPGPGRWLVYSTSPAASTENGLTGAAGSALPRLYNRTFGGNPPASVTEPGNHLIYSAQPALTIAPDNQSKIYGANDPAQTFVAAGFVNDDGVLDATTTAGLAGSFGRAVGEAVGTRLITQGTFNSGAGYSIAFNGTGTLTITPAALNVTADDASRLQGTPNPPFTATYNGFRFGETPAVLTGTLSFSTTAIIGSPPGPYPIAPFGQGSTNYAITYVDGTLLVTSGAVSQPGAGIFGVATNLVVGGFQQLGTGASTGNGSGCAASNRTNGSALLTAANEWATGACTTQDSKPVTLVVAPAAKSAPLTLAPTATAEPAPEMAALPWEKPAAQRRADPRGAGAAPGPADFPGPRALQYNDVMTAVMFRDPAAVIVLLNLGWPVDHPDSNGRTPLMAAAVNGYVAMARLLLQRGADPNRRAPGGSVLDFARRGGSAEVIELLLRAGAR
jgi:hypothetical protein